ncbi:hypothetical protein DNTS_029036 [Danionella cerebrum]|uniref:CIDE-N domain-containing protein n=1 Tax=Danionella cerebrum TaxID=2873325 RepID=A0A553R3B1_9TELE|nr:hypothetical protein DNTS_029036 [Danionella translucida]
MFKVTEVIQLIPVENAKKSFSKCVGACGSMKQQLLPRWTHSRPFRVITSDRTMKKGIMAENLQDLRNKVMDIFQIPCVSTLVLDEDGTGIDTEDFFQTLKDNTVLMVLENGQKWTPPKKQKTKGDPERHRKDVAKVTFDLYKNHPRDFIGCLNMQATFYGMEALRWTLFTLQTTGHVLVGTSCYIQHLMDEEEKADAKMALALPYFIKQLKH